MKKLIVIIFILCSIFVVTQHSYAQENTFFFIQSTYNSPEDLDFLFSHSTRVLKYLKGEELEKPLFLGLITQEQKGEFDSQGYAYEVIDENISSDEDLNAYELLFSYEADTFDLLEPYGEVRIIGAHWALFKARPDVPEGHDAAGKAFFGSPWPQGSLPTPLYKTDTITKTPSPVPQPPSQTPTGPLGNNTIVFALVLFGVLAALTVGVIAVRRKQTQNSQ